MTVADTIFIAGLLAFLVGIGLIDYRASMIAGGALAMLYAILLGRALTSRRQPDPNQEQE